MSDFREYLAQQLQDPKFKAEWDALEPEFQIIRAIIEGRTARQFSEEQLAEATGISPAEITRLEEGAANPTLNELKRHPYINFFQAKAITDYRRLRGPIHSLQDLRLSKDFPPEAIQRLEPYVEYE